MGIMIFIALGHGLLIGLARVLNARLTLSSHSLWASACNHLVGFGVLCGLLFMGVSNSNLLLQDWFALPPYLYLAGVIGAAYVAVNSYVVPLVGVTLTTLLVMSSQFITSFFVDLALGLVELDSALYLHGMGFGFIGLGLYLSYRRQG
mgnify:FL=1